MTTIEDISSISTDDAFSFLSDVLCISEPGKKLKANRVLFVGDILRAMYHHIPWQTVQNLATPCSERHLPTPAEIKDDVNKKIGGFCYTFNIFGLMLLRALGFKVALVPATVINIVVHLLLIVKNLTSPGSKHMVDFGAGSPSFRPIPLDFEEISPEYTDSFLRYRFVRQGDDVIRQHNIQSDPGNTMISKLVAVDDEWFSFYFIHASRHVTVEHFTSTISGFYTNPDHPSGFLSNMYCYAYPNGRLVRIKNTTLLLEGENGHVQKSYFRSREEILAAFASYFPQIPRRMIEAAMADKNVKLAYNKQLK